MSIPRPMYTFYMFFIILCLIIHNKSVCTQCIEFANIVRTKYYFIYIIYFVLYWYSYILCSLQLIRTEDGITKLKSKLFSTFGSFYSTEASFTGWIPLFANLWIPMNLKKKLFKIIVSNKWHKKQPIQISWILDIGWELLI